MAEDDKGDDGGGEQDETLPRRRLHLMQMESSFSVIELNMGSNLIADLVPLTSSSYAWTEVGQRARASRYAAQFRAAGVVGPTLDMIPVKAMRRPCPSEIHFSYTLHSEERLLLS